MSPFRPRVFVMCIVSDDPRHGADLAAPCMAPSPTSLPHHTHAGSTWTVAAAHRSGACRRRRRTAVGCRGGQDRMPIGQPVDVLMRPAAGVTPDQRLACASAYYRISGPHRRTYRGEERLPARGNCVDQAGIGSEVTGARTRPARPLPPARHRPRVPQTRSRATSSRILPGSCTAHCCASSPGKCLISMLEQKPRQSSFSLFRGIFCLRDHQPDRPPRESVRLVIQCDFVI